MLARYPNQYTAPHAILEFGLLIVLQIKFTLVTVSGNYRLPKTTDTGPIRLPRHRLLSFMSYPWRKFHQSGLLRFQCYSKQVSLVGK